VASVQDAPNAPEARSDEAEVDDQLVSSSCREALLSSLLPHVGSDSVSMRDVPDATLEEAEEDESGAPLNSRDAQSSSSHRGSDDGEVAAATPLVEPRVCEIKLQNLEPDQALALHESGCAEPEEEHDPGPASSDTSKAQDPAPAGAQEVVSELSSAQQVPEGAHSARKGSKSRQAARNRLTLQGVGEVFVLKRGLRILRDQLVDPAAWGAEKLPRRPNGSSMLLQSFFFERLLRDKVEFRSLLANDVLAAQGDLKHLKLEHLLLVRMGAMDFSTECRTHEAHANFLATLERNLFEQLAQRHLPGSSAETVTSETDSELPRKQVLQRLGALLTLLVGTAGVLNAGHPLSPNSGSGSLELRSLDEGSAGATDSTGCVEVPELWLLPLGIDEWPGHRAVMISTGTDLWLRALAAREPSEVSALAVDRRVAVVSDRAQGTRRERQMRWDVDVLDPNTDDVLAALSRSIASHSHRAGPSGSGRVFTAAAAAAAASVGGKGGVSSSSRAARSQRSVALHRAGLDSTSLDGALTEGFGAITSDGIARVGADVDKQQAAVPSQAIHVIRSPKSGVEPSVAELSVRKFQAFCSHEAVPTPVRAVSS